MASLKDLTVTFLGCGKLGSAILDGLLVSSGAPGKLRNFPDELDPMTLKTLIACVQREESQANLQQKYARNSTIVKVLRGENAKAVREADIIVLGCKPYAYKELFAAEPGMVDALAGKIMISIMVGVSASTIQDTLYDTSSSSSSSSNTNYPSSAEQQKCHIVTAIPNTAAAVAQSATILFESESPLPEPISTEIFAFLSLIGTVKLIPPSQASLFPVLATLGASTAAFFSLFVEGIADGAAELGVPKEDAVELLAATMRGTAAMIGGGDSLEAIRRRIATPGGTTEKGLLHLQENHVTGVIAEALKKSSSAAGKAGKKESWFTAAKSGGS